MDGKRFDRLARQLALRSPRRQLFAFAGRVAASLLALATVQDDGTAKKKRKPKKPAACGAAGASCGSDGQCCSGLCVKNGPCVTKKKGKKPKPTGSCRCDSGDGGGAITLGNTFSGIGWPFRVGDGQWFIVNGYRGHVDHGVPQDSSLQNTSQAFGLDFVKCLGGSANLARGTCGANQNGWDREATRGSDVFAPVTGTVSWSDFNSVGIDIEGAAGHVLVLAHVAGLPTALGTPVHRWDKIGTVSSGDSIPHIHMSLYKKNDGGTPSRIPVEFRGPFEIGGCSFKDKGSAVRNQYQDQLVPCNTSCAACNTKIRIEAAVYDPADGRSIFAGAAVPSHATIPAEVKITGTTNQIFTNTVNVTYDDRRDAYVGILDLGTGIANGSYAIAVKFRDRVRTLRKQLPGFITLQKGATAVAPVILTPGDVNDDDSVNILDYNLLVGCYGANPSSCDAERKKWSDLNDDGAVNEFDFNLMVRVIGNARALPRGSTQTDERNSGPERAGGQTDGTKRHRRTRERRWSR